MLNFSISLSGLDVVQRALELVGTNMANATTEGYHRQDPVIRAVSLNTYGVVSIGGVEITGVRRAIDDLLEMEIVRQQSLLDQTSQELSVLETVEAAFGEVGSASLDVAISHFFDSMTKLIRQPGSQNQPEVSHALREQVVWAADSLAGQFRIIGQFINDAMVQVQRQAEQYVDQANTLTAEITDLNQQIASVSMRGGSANILRDHRDQAILELAGLISIEVTGQSGKIGSMNIVTNGMQLVTGSSAMPLELQITSDGEMGIALEGGPSFRTDVDGGKIGALLALRNDILPGIQNSLDTLAKQIVTEINRLHVQGTGIDGSFDEVTGTSVASTTLDEWPMEIESGSFFIRVIDTTTGSVTRYEIAVDPTTDTVTTIQTDLDALANISASIINSTLHIEADNGYQFDFLPAVSSNPYADNITGTAEATISGIYDGNTNQIFTLTVAGNGDVGVDGDLVLEVRDGNNDLTKTVNIGQGYAAGDTLDISNGMYVALSTGSLANGDNFTIQAIAYSDTSGFLAAAGINTLFSGNSASNMNVREEILNHPRRLAGDISDLGGDGINIRRMADIVQQTFSALDYATPQGYFHQVVTDLGQTIMVRQARLTSTENVARQLANQRNEISGVDLNNEAAKLIIFERMYQALSKSLSTQNRVLQFLFDIT